MRITVFGRDIDDYEGDFVSMPIEIPAGEVARTFAHCGPDADLSNDGWKLIVRTDEGSVWELIE